MTQLVIADELGLTYKDHLQSCIALAEEVDRTIFGLIRAVERRK